VSNRHDRRRRACASDISPVAAAFVNFTVGAGAFLVIGMLSPLAQSLSMSKVQAGWVMSALRSAMTSPRRCALTGDCGGAPSFSPSLRAPPA
jgi:predicted MFS family arabinose efflux permease